MAPFSSIFALFFFLALFGAAAVLTGVLRRLAIRKRWFAVPNERSAHTIPTPRGGGLAIALVFFLGCAILVALRVIHPALAAALIGGGVLVAGISWFDDLRNVHVGIRLVIHFIAVSWALFFLGEVSTLDLGFTTIRLGFFMHLIPLGMVWMINLYNFMDGLDGLAGSQAVLVGVFGGVIAALSGAWDIAMIAWLLAAASGGFLVWNWPPAKIFMSDTGSVLIGFVFAVLAVAGERSGSVPLLVWILLLLVFVVDATLTTVRRFLKGEKWFAGHRTFAFHHYVRRGASHRAVTLGVMAITTVLGFAAVVAWWRPAFLVPLVVVGVLCLSVVWVSAQRIRTVSEPIT